MRFVPAASTYPSRLRRPANYSSLLPDGSPTPQPSDFTTRLVTLLQTQENDINTNDQLQQLVFSSPDTLSPPSLLRITRRLGTATKALQFFNYIRTNSPSPPALSSLSSAFQAVLELASLEQKSFHPSRLYELFNFTREHNVPLTINSATLLIRCFGLAGMLERSRLVYNELAPDSLDTNMRNAILDALFRSGQLGDALKLLDEMLETQKEYPPNENTINILMDALLKRRWAGKIVSEEKIVGLVVKFGEHGVFPNAVWITRLITGLCKSRRSDKAWDLLHALMRLGCDLEASSCNALLTNLGRERDFERMNLLLNEMKEQGIQPNVVTFGILINHLCKCRRIDDALEVFKKMSGDDENIRPSVAPDVILYNTLIDGLCKVGRLEEGLALMEEMRSKHECMPNTVTYNCLIDGFCKAGEIEKSHVLFDQMNEEGVPQNVITMNTLVDGMCKNGRTSSAMEFFNMMQDKGLKGNTVTYTALINAFCNVNNISKAKDLFNDMLKAGCSPDALLYYTLINGLTMAGKLDDANHFVSMLKEAGFCLDIVCYNVLIGGFCRKNKVNKAYEMLKDMEQCGVKPDSVTYNTLISYFSERRHFTTAHTLMRKMLSDGFVPTRVTFGALINAYCLVDKLDEAMKIFKDMSSSSKISPNTVIYNILIDSHCKNRKIEDALSLMDDMKEKGVRPNTATYNAIFKGLQEINWLETAFKVMDQMTEHACNPDYITMETLTEWLSAVGETEKLRSFVQGYQVSTIAA